MTTFLGCLSYINVTKECYEVGLSNKMVHSWHFYHNHATKELLHEQMCKTKANNIN